MILKFDNYDVNVTVLEEDSTSMVLRSDIGSLFLFSKIRNKSVHIGSDGKRHTNPATLTEE